MSRLRSQVRALHRAAERAQHGTHGAEVRQALAWFRENGQQLSEVIDAVDTDWSQDQALEHWRLVREGFGALMTLSRGGVVDIGELFGRAFKKEDERHGAA